MPKGIYQRTLNSQWHNCRKPIQQVFWSRVNKNGPIHKIHGQCWLWTGSLYGNGYGQFRNKRAHRVAYELTQGCIPNRAIVMHKCDNPRCVNPDHLVVGTHADNTRDMVNKHRESHIGTRTPSHGEHNGRAKLTSAMVIQARSLYASGISISAISKLLGSPVCLGRLHDAIVRKSFKDVP